VRPFVEGGDLVPGPLPSYGHGLDDRHQVIMVGKESFDSSRMEDCALRGRHGKPRERAQDVARQLCRRTDELCSGRRTGKNLPVPKLSKSQTSMRIAA
jgi:hypothetical protein